MATVRLTDARKRYSATEVLNGIDLEIADGEFLVLVGPSGCGKSTLLRSIAGLEDLDDGTIAIDGTDVRGMAPNARGIAMVFQSYALYPHLSVAENMGFALRIARAPRAEIDAAVRAAAETLGITHLLERRPAALSGGQRQRVAIGRAIVRRPRVFLLDEPLSNLDASLRVRMRYEFAELHRRLGTTMVYVTHDQAEAMTLADRIVVMNAGRIEQIGRPLDLYERPANLFVAGFIGSPRMNLISAVLAEPGVVALADGARIAVPADTAGIAPGAPVTLGIRPEAIVAGEGVATRVRFVEALGNATFAHLEAPCSPEPIVWQAPGDVRPAIGDPLSIALPDASLHLFDGDGRAVPRNPSFRDAA